MATDTSRSGTTRSPVTPRYAAEPSRPWSLWLGAGLLGALGLLMVAAGSFADDPEPSMAAVGAVVLVAAVVALVLRVVGWWLAVVACGGLILLALLGISSGGKGTGALAVGLCWLAVTGALLLLARPPGAGSDTSGPPDISGASGASGAAAVHGLRRPEGWTREWGGGWVKFVVMAGFGGLCLLVGGLMTLGSFSSDRNAPPQGPAVLALAFGTAIVATVPMFWPRRTGRPELREHLPLLGAGAAVAFPYSRARTRAALVGVVAFAAVGAAMAVYGDSTALRVLGGGCVVLFAFFAWVRLRRRARKWAIVASPHGVGLVEGPGEVFVPWSAVRDIVADETTTYYRGIPNHEPHIAVLTEPDTVQHQDTVDQRLAEVSRHWSRADVTWSVRALAVDPVLVIGALRHYLHNPDQRAELGDRRALDRVARGDLQA